MTSLGIERSCAGRRTVLASIVVAGSLFGALGCGSSFATNDDDTASGGSSTGGAATGGAATGGAATGGAATGGSSTGGTASGGASTGGSTGTGGSASGECTATSPCSAGTCTGSSCEGAWSCVVSEAGCTKDLVEYCGCNGETFMDSGTCPSRPYSNKGACTGPTLVDCNPAHIKCLPIIAPPACPEGQAYSVVDNCHGSCVPVTQCACDTQADCPDPNNTDEYACYNNSGSCGPWLR